MKAFLLALLSLPALGFAQGALTPAGAPAPSMKTLDQIEARTPLGVVGTNTIGLRIRKPGSYVLMGNITVVAGEAIEIDSSNVTLDLNGFTLSTTSIPASGTAIYLNPSCDNVVIRNGHIGGSGSVNPITGEFLGAGFDGGIACLDTLVNVFLSDLTISGCRAGIFLFSSSTIDRCVVTSCGLGISGQTVTNCSATSCVQTAIEATTASNSQGTSYNGIGLKATERATNCSGTTQSGPYGLRVASNDATPVLGSAENCNGTVASGTGIGLSAGTSTNCHGTSASGSGIDAKSVANSYGKSTAGHGISATTVTGSTGESTDKDGVHCTISSDSFGYSYNMTGFSAATATNCYGASHAGYGLYAQEATNCHGKSDTGTRGLHADNTATGCTGEITTVSGGGSSCGLWTTTAANCRGVIGNETGANGGYIGLSADIAQNCFGFAASGNGLRVTTSALNCYGASIFKSGIGLEVTQGTASSCSGASGSNFLGFGTALKAGIAVSCTSAGGSIVAPQKFLGTP